MSDMHCRSVVLSTGFPRSPAGNAGELIGLRMLSYLFGLCAVDDPGWVLAYGVHNPCFFAT